MQISKISIVIFFLLQNLNINRLTQGKLSLDLTRRKKKKTLT